MKKVTIGTWLGNVVSSLFLLTIILSGCTTQQNSQNQTLNTSKQSITYSNSASSVLIRTFHGGGLYGTFSLGPQTSIYGDGTYILGLEQKGQLQTTALQQLLTTIVDTYGLLNFKRQQFADMPDQDATFLELTLNGKQTELMYGSFGTVKESAQDLDEYQRLGKALTAITEALHGPTQPYTSKATALLVRQIFTPDYTKAQNFYLPGLSLVNTAIYECGPVPPDTTSDNKEIGCLLYTIPQNALLLTDAQVQAFKDLLQGETQGEFRQEGLYYSVTLRPLLPDEQQQKVLAMFGSAQQGYKGVPLHEGPVPDPTPTPQA